MLDQYWLLDGFDFRRSNKYVHDLVNYFVDLALKRDPKSRDNEKGNPDDQKESTYFSTLLATQTRDPIEFRSQLPNIFLAGRGITASFLGFVFYVLARHPDIHSRLRASILHEFRPYREDASDSTSFSTPQKLHLSAIGIERNPTLPRCCPAKRAKSTEGYDATTGRGA
jgi:cytochrome P450